MRDNIEESNNRIRWIDIAKGITILLVIFGHSFENESIATKFWRGVIFSWHMPLFFLLSAMTYRFPKNNTEMRLRIKKDLKHLLLPLLGVYVFGIVYSLCKEPQNIFSLEYWRGTLYQIVLAAGMPTYFISFEVPALGMVWFLMVLLIGRLLFAAINLAFEPKQVPIICAVISLLAINTGVTAFSIDIALAIQVFFCGGYLLQKKGYSTGKSDPRVLFGALLIWMITFYISFPNVEVKTYLELAIRSYSLYPIGFMCAFAGIVTMCEISKCLDGLTIISRMFGLIGANSIYLFLIHCLDHLEPVMAVWRVENAPFLSGVIRILVDVTIFFVGWGLLKIKKRFMTN